MLIVTRYIYVIVAYIIILIAMLKISNLGMAKAQTMLLNAICSIKVTMCASLALMIAIVVFQDNSNKAQLTEGQKGS